MCCIFTCCGWMIDLVQRLWTFTMSCCISSAVCCLLMTGSMSGIALGYNYSLAEYIDLKETNVSVYLKRGVFDDEIANDMDWRRSGRMPVAGHIGTDNLRTGAPADEDSTPLQSGRRLDDSVFESDEAHKYEGSLMKLTAQPLYPGTRTTTTEFPEYVQAPTGKFSPGSLDQLKEIQGMINARKAAMATMQSKQTTYPDIDERYLAQLPLNPNQPPQGRRIMGAPDMVDRLNPARFAVPPQSIGSKENWIYPKEPAKYRVGFSYSAIDYPDFNPKYPSPVPLRTGPIRPPKPSPTPEMRTYETEKDEIPTLKELPMTPMPEANAAMKAFKEKMMLEKFEAPANIYRNKPKDSDDYDEDVKGLPVRRRRSARENVINNVEEAKTADSMISLSKNIDIKKVVNVMNVDDERVLERGHFTVSNENKNTIKLKPNLISETIKTSIRRNYIQNNLSTKITSEGLINDSTYKEESNTNIPDYIGNVFNKLLDVVHIKASNINLKLNDASRVKNQHGLMDTDKTLSTLGISVNDMKPSIMARILQSTIA